MDRLCAIWMRLTLPDGVLSLLNAAATPGTRLAVENSGRCSRGAFDEAFKRKFPAYSDEAGDDGVDRFALSCWSVSSSSCAIWPIFFWRALVRPLVNRCLAAMQRIWSSNINLADKIGERLVVAPPRWIVMWRQRESSLSPVTSTSCRNPTSFAIPQPSFFESGSTRINCSASITKKRRYLVPSFSNTVHAIKSLLSRMKQNSFFQKLHIFCWVRRKTYSNPICHRHGCMNFD